MTTMQEAAAAKRRAAIDALVPYLRPRLVEWADVPPAGHIGRFDNDLYFLMQQEPKSLAVTPVFRFLFLLVPGEDGAPRTPPLDAVSRASCVWWGMDIHPLGGILDTQEGRGDLRRLQLKLGASFAGMSTIQAKPSAKYGSPGTRLEAGDPKRWVHTWFTLPPRGFLGRLGYDWAAVGQTVLGAVDEIRLIMIKGLAR